MKKTKHLILIFILLPFIICSGNELTKEEKARILFNKALTLMRENKPIEAEKIYNEIIEKYPSTKVAVEINIMLLQQKRINKIYNEGNQGYTIDETQIIKDDEKLQEYMKDDLKKAKLNDYYSQIWNLIKSNWFIPDTVYNKEKDLLTVISIRLGKDGTIKDIKFETESGVTIFDKSALMAIKRVKNFPPFPPEIDVNSIEIGIRFSPG